MATHGGARVTTAPVQTHAPDKPNVAGLAQQYGEGVEFADLQQKAPVGRPPSAVPSSAPDGGGGGAPFLDLSGVTGLGEPSTNPAEAVTTGAPAIPEGNDMNEADAKGLSPEFVAWMVNRATRGDTTLAFKNLVRSITSLRGM